MSRRRAPALAAPAAGAERASFTVASDMEGERIDRAIASKVPALSRGHARRILAMGAVYLGTDRCRVASRKVYAGDVITVTWHPDVQTSPRIPLVIVHEDPHAAVIAKPAGQLSQGSELGDVGSIVYEVGRRFGDAARLMHRLDKPASGLLLVGITPEAVAAFTPQMRDHTLSRRYFAVTEGVPAEGPCETMLVRVGRRIRAAAPDEPGAMSARSDVAVLHQAAGRALVEVTLHTGRTHQIRVHLASLGAPIVGDRRYGGPQAARLCLHARTLAFDPPSGPRVALQHDPEGDFWEAAGFPRPDAVAGV